METRGSGRRALAQVFRIINEFTRRPAPNPAVRAIQQGIVVGLANHTLLIGRNGREIRLIIAPFVLQFRANRIAMANEIALGILIAADALWALRNQPGDTRRQ